MLEKCNQLLTDTEMKINCLLDCKVLIDKFFILFSQYYFRQQWEIQLYD